MPATPDEIMQQVLGQVQALERLSAKERQQRPYSHFGQNFNRLLSLAKEAMPSVDSLRWPAELTIHTAAMGPEHIDARYVEIHGYMKEIVAILAEGIDFPAGGLRG